MDDATTFYVLRYHDDVPLKDRRHQFTRGRHATWTAAELARAEVPRPFGELLEVVERAAVAR